jgi:hypothetical protein
MTTKAIAKIKTTNHAGRGSVYRQVTPSSCSNGPPADATHRAFRPLTRR